MKILENENYIIGRANEADWKMHKDRHATLTESETVSSNVKDMIEQLDKETEYMIIRDYEDDKEFEASLIIHCDGKYYFVTNAGLHS